LLTSDRYLESLEAQESHLQQRINELEAKLRELDPSINGFTRSNSYTQNFLTPPETSNTQVQSSTYLSPTVDSTHSHSLSPHCTNYVDEHSVDNSTVFQALGGQGDQDANTDPGVFESGDAGKGWYLGCASGSTSLIILYLLKNLVIYMNSIKNTASSGTSLSFRYLIEVLGIELDLSEFSPLSKSVSGKAIPSLLSELHSHRSRKPVKPVLPPKDLGIELVNDFFATINLLCPLIHRPSFYREVIHLKFN
jgi:hypothetical protein